MNAPGGIKENPWSSIVSLSLPDVGHALLPASLAYHDGVASRDRWITSAARSLLCADECTNRWFRPRGDGARVA